MPDFAEDHGGIASAMVLGGIRAYRRLVSPLLPSRCRFYPTCSEYAEQAVSRYGAAKGSWLALKRLCRCNRLFPGGLDPVP